MGTRVRMFYKIIDADVGRHLSLSSPAGGALSDIGLFVESSC